MKSKKISVSLLMVLLSITIIFSGCGKTKKDTLSKNNSTTEDTTEQTTPDNSDNSSNNNTAITEDDSAIKPPAQSTITPAVWEVTDSDGNNIYMMGSIHMADINATVFPDYFETAYSECDYLAVECDITDMQMDIFSTYQQMMYTDGTLITDHVSKESYDKVVKLLKNAGQYMSSYDYMKPMIWVELIETIAAGKSGLSEKYGVDSILIKRAKKENKGILEVESAEFQLELLFNMSDDIQSMLFDSIAKDGVIEESTEQLKNLYENWKAGTITEEDTTDAVDEDMTDEDIELLNEYNRLLLYDRNVGMADKAMAYMKDGKKVMFVVGAAHFYGDQGILKLMEDAGCTVTKLSPEETDDEMKEAA